MFVVPGGDNQGDDPFVVNLGQYEVEEVNLSQFEAPRQVDLGEFEDNTIGDPFGLGPAQPAMMAPQPIQHQVQPSWTSNPAPRKKRHVNRNTGKYVGATIGIIAAIGGVVGLVFLVMGLIGSPHERMVKKMMRLTEKTVESLESVTDTASAQQAVTDIQNYTKQLVALKPKMMKLKQPSQAVERRLDKMMKEKMDELKPRITKVMQSLQRRPSLAMQLAPAMMSMGKAFEFDSRMPRMRSPGFRSPSIHIPANPSQSRLRIRF